MKLKICANIRVIQIENIVHHFLSVELVEWNAFDDWGTPEYRGDQWNWIIFYCVKLCVLDEGQLHSRQTFRELKTS